jgi:hypothetical protein
VSWFQKKIRGNMMALNDHIAKEMNELNLIRCQHIPKRPGCDWHDLPDEKVMFQTILLHFCCCMPSCFPWNTNSLAVLTGETVQRPDGGPDTLVPTQHCQEAQSVEGSVREAGLGGQLPHICHRSPANGQGRHVLPP